MKYKKYTTRIYIDLSFERDVIAKDKYEAYRKAKKAFKDECVEGVRIGEGRYTVKDRFDIMKFEPIEEECHDPSSD